MTAIKASAMALIIATLPLYSTFKPSDYEQLAESPTGITAEMTQEVENDVKPEEPVVTETEETSEQAPPKPVTYEYEATFYTASCRGCSGITATGYDVRQTQYYEGYRVIAADKSVPFGTIMRITLEDGTQFDGMVLDRGGAIKGARLDVLVASKSEAYRLGRQRATVTILN